MRAALVVLVVLVGCVRAETGPRSRSVYVDVILPYETLTATAEASGAWNQAAGCAALGNAIQADARHPGEIWVTSADLPPDALARTFPPDSTDTIVVQIGAGAFAAENTWGLDGLLVHELGHAMGLGHSIHGPQDVMNATCAPNWAISESDARELQILRESGAVWSFGSVQI